MQPTPERRILHALRRRAMDTPALTMWPDCDATPYAEALHHWGLIRWSNVRGKWMLTSAGEAAVTEEGGGT